MTGPRVGRRQLQTRILRLVLILGLLAGAGQAAAQGPSSSAPTAPARAGARAALDVEAIRAFYTAYLDQLERGDDAWAHAATRQHTTAAFRARVAQAERQTGLRDQDPLVLSQDVGMTWRTHMRVTPVQDALTARGHAWVCVTLGDATQERPWSLWVDVALAPRHGPSTWRIDAVRATPPSIAPRAGGSR